MSTMPASTAGADLSARGLLAGVIHLLRAHPLPLLAPLLVFALVTTSSGGGADPFAGYSSEFEGGDPFPRELLPVFAAIGALAILLAAVLFLVFALVWLVTTRAALTAAEGGTPHLRSAFDAVKPRYWRGTGTFALWVLVFIFGLILLIVPGIFAAAALVPWAAVVLTENRSGPEALTRAWELTEGHRGKLFLLVLAAFGLRLAAGVVLAPVPLVGILLADLVGGLVNAALATLGAVFYVRVTTAATPAAAPQPIV